MALLSQEGSTIELKRDRARGGSKAASLQGCWEPPPALPF
jgi:hypothetical protein